MTTQPDTTQPPRPNTGMPLIAGILVIASEGFTLLSLSAVFLAGIFITIPVSIHEWSPVVLLPLVVFPFLAFTALSVIGGILAIQKKHWGIALTGAIIAALPFSLLGIAAVILLALSKEEFVS